MRSSTSTVLAFLAAPVLPAIAAGLGTPVTSTAQTFLGPVSADPVTVFGFALLFYFVALPISIVLGVPALVVLRSYNLIRLWSAALVGSIIGMLGILIIVGDRVLRTRSFAQDAHVLLLYGGIGAISGLVFWLVWRQGKARAA